jgi:hypothetical protein
VTSIAHEREELEAALAQAEAARDHLEAAFAKAKAALVSTVTDAAKVDANHEEAAAKVEKARARCRQLRAALIDPALSERITRSRSRARIDTVVKQSGGFSKPEAVASPPSTQLTERAVRGEINRSQDRWWRQIPIHRFKFGFFKKKSSHTDSLARATLVRQTIELSGLVFAYLLYFHIDVQLQILRLVSIVGWILR